MTPIELYNNLKHLSIFHERYLRGNVKKDERPTGHERMLIKEVFLELYKKKINISCGDCVKDYLSQLYPIYHQLKLAYEKEGS